MLTGTPEQDFPVAAGGQKAGLLPRSLALSRKTLFERKLLFDATPLDH